MLFNSFSFLIYFPLVVALYYVLPHRFRTILLFLASCYFYMAFVPQYVLILFGLIGLDFLLGQAIEKRTGAARRNLLILSVIANLGTLFFFKYFNFFNENVAALAHAIGWNYSPLLLQIVLPLGLSFHVFQSLSYVIEVYRGRYPAERNLLDYATFVMFFPQLVAGPIERPQQLLPQFKEAHRFDPDGVGAGLQRMLWGFFKKIVVADNLASYVDQVYLHPTEHSGAVLVVATIFFAFQIYCDFSGYSDIAVGSARVLGFNLINNFERPFLSTSMAEFWRRWHISLSNWLRDYLYYPLALSATGNTKLRVAWALFLTMLLIGLWHGAAWTFVAFGAAHGAFLVIGQLTKKWRDRAAAASGFARLPRLRRAWQTVATFALACVGFILFRADSIRHAWHILVHAFVGIFSGAAAFIQATFAAVSARAAAPLTSFLNSLILDSASRKEFVFFWALILFVAITEVLLERGRLLPQIAARPWLRWPIYIAAALAIMNLGVTHEIPFIYFAF